VIILGSRKAPFFLSKKDATMRFLFLFVLIIAHHKALANPYIEYKREDNTVRHTHQEHLRIGYKADNNLYLEAGTMTDNKISVETGYKFKQNNWVFKGKFELKDKSEKLETEIRYTF
jgi:hypothetical protein